MFIAVFYIIAKNWLQPRCLSLKTKKEDKLLFISTVGYYLVVKMDKVQIHTTTCMRLKTLIGD